jgi:hypothetical protein
MLKIIELNFINSHVAGEFHGVSLKDSGIGGDDRQSRWKSVEQPDRGGRKSEEYAA